MSVTEFALDISKFDPDQPRDWRGRWVHIGGKLFKIIDAPGDGDSNFHYERASGADKKESRVAIHDEANRDGSKKLKGSSARKPATKKPAAKKINIRDWNQGSENTNAIRASGNKVLGGKTPATATEKNAAALLDAINNAPATKRALYRGMLARGESLSVAKKQFKVGSVIDLGLSSFTGSRDVAKDYTTMAENRKIVKGTKILFTMKPGSRSLDVAKLGGDSHEEEFISAGQFRITSIRTPTEEVELQNYVGPVLNIEIEQVGTYDVS